MLPTWMIYYCFFAYGAVLMAIVDRIDKTKLGMERNIFVSAIIIFLASPLTFLILVVFHIIPDEDTKTKTKS